MIRGKVQIAAGAAVLLAALGGCDTMNALLDDKPGNAFSQTEAMPPQDQDVTFVQTAAAAGNKEVALSELAVEQADRDDVEQFARQMVADHSAANQELMAIAGDRSIEVPAAPSEQEAASAAGLGNLEGEAFDSAYVAEMVKDHEQAIALFEAQVANGSDPELVAFAESKLPTLRAHLEHVQSLQ